MKQTILSLENVTVELLSGGEIRQVLQNISFDVFPGEILGLVGESGSGKSVTAAAIMQLLPGGSKAIAGGKILFKGQDLVNKTPAQMQAIRGNEMAMIFQEPMTSLNPVFTIGTQFVDIIRTHKAVTKHEAIQQALNMLKAVHIPDSERIFQSYPYELSGGMRQRVMIAMAQSCSPSLLIADEPTTALDVTIQAQILRLLRTTVQNSQSSVIFISHDLGVISQLCQRVAVMYAGEIVECGRVETILQDPKHPYTKALLHSIPDFSTKGRTLTSIPGTVPDVRAIVNGCRFHPRCAERQEVCSKQKPASITLPENHRINCWQASKERY
ncbi:putative D,D-dipeptide transport ATP-binding protein DdpD [Sporomusa ovata DSM 2662]|uniref:Oligopeptide transport ATP-binding protein OppD (TC 3.A.1.5.1) n=1 Tax=Sporomusa ovata TaxID=2378 RepID=A0A0U1KXH7_9FIRM|nr:ABC transporter ATP-binding protein [Sporomusa ovata]EQB29563.1 oligopeptide/dipeptide ABC transporter, ATP-binding protein [Sporomusa ovata DSM 2662]CQR72076.1 Oligopeptide transport ATP-binding protein OppD (TC 3.A.1.5.1) [Sporomusa ovata]